MEGRPTHSGWPLDVAPGLFTPNREAGIVVGDEGVAVPLVDVVASDTLSQENGSAEGRGLSVHHGAALDATRVLMSRNRAFGVLASGAGAVVRLFDVVVAETDEPACAASACAEFPYGVGLLGAYDAHLEVCLQADGYAVTRLTDGVRYVDNGVNLSATTLPVPGPGSLGVAP